MTPHITQPRALAAAIGLAFGPLAGGPALADSAAQTIEERLEQYEARFNRKDAEAIAMLFSPDVVYYDALGGVHQGRDAVKRYYQNNFAAGFKDMTLSTIEVKVFDDIAYDVARFTISSPAGERLTGRHLAVLEKEGGEWMVQRTLVNVAMPPPAAK